MTDINANTVWSAVYSPFGATTSINANPEVMNARFPGQWFQLETGLAYNRHRHYDPTTGRYVQPDPLTVDDGGDTAVKGLATDLSGSRGLVGSSDAHATAKSMGWQDAHDIIMSWPSSRVMLQDGPSLYGYAGQNALGKIDPKGLQVEAACLLGPNPVCDAVLFRDAAIIVVGICEMAGHKKGARPSTESKHEDGDARRGQDQGGEKGDKNRMQPRQRPPDFKGPYPPPDQ